ncbi:hypothetical protein Alches_16180 [Alicyclobacillus hesperidum subsp. aegles]|uniref:Panacea domain-containing protein n=1 Tax=Alicyclobacillus hesperidum TaxID=89784 RepID=UPI00222BF343|nr:type II toxin-antitoxin system antitoxin SocA domain-containing protein [Alicyclobacillus hesperidum]GLG01578.1 hypothetical protein Alches_16180 [Alicyclobacillus hesperidum subsp. aegles]
MVTATILANNILRRSFDQKSPITPMKLQKLLYFIYRDYLQQTGKPLFAERFEVWKYGPVISSVYHEFKQYRSGPVKDYSKDSAGESYLVKETDLLRQIIDDNWNKFKNVNGIYMSEITHRPKTAWRAAWDKRQYFLDDEDIKNDNEGKSV